MNDSDSLEQEPIKNKDLLPHDDLYAILRKLRGTPDHLWLGSDQERTRHAYNAITALLRRRERGAVEAFAERGKERFKSKHLHYEYTEIEFTGKEVAETIDAELAKWKEGEK